MAKRKGEIHLSPKYGLNPSLGLCFFCGEENGEVVLPGRLPHDHEAPRRAIWSLHPCSACKTRLTDSILLIEVADGEEAAGLQAERTGYAVWIKEPAFLDIMKDTPMTRSILRHRWAFVLKADWDQMGLPRAES